MSETRKGGSFGFVIGIFALVGVLFAAYSAYWIYMRGQLEAGVMQWIEDERIGGARVAYDHLTLGGYPYRFALDVDAPDYESPDGLAWSGERLQLVMQPWNWNHVIARAPGENRMGFAGARLNAALGEKSAGSLSWTSESLTRLSVSLDEAEIDTPGGETWTAKAFELHVRPPPDDPDALQLVLQWERLGLPQPVEAAAFLGEDVQASRLLVEAKNVFPVLQRGGGLREWATAGGDLDVAQLLLNWGPLSFGAKADLTLGMDGLFDGAVDVRLDEGEGLIEAMLGSGLDEETFAQASMAITALDAASEDGGFLSLSVRDGEVRYLGQTLAAAPPAF